ELNPQDEGARPRPTPAGRPLRHGGDPGPPRARAEIHEGIPDEEFVAALKVLQRMIRNVGGRAWHE
ncbi:MarR family transcriptional regulator, partial [Streptomyces cyaneofuscatus]